ncbi:MAG: cyanophycinase [Proteobacteria bacterium]|nr:cyanophycinase [Pseudomonadota bacterium]
MSKIDSTSRASDAKEAARAQALARLSQGAPHESQSSDSSVKGSLFIIGGAEDKKGAMRVLRRFVELCGGSSASIGVLATAKPHSPQAADVYVELFRGLGVRDVYAMPIMSRNDAFNPKYVRFMEQLTGAFFTGGNQLALTSAIGGTTLSQALYRMYERGGVVGGTSAGASAVSRHMIMSGTTGLSPRKGKVMVGAGLGLLKNVVVDQHFSARRRIGRLLTVVAHNPFLLGIGIDEDTACHILPDKTFSVCGSGTVTVLDGGEITYTNVPFVDNTNVPLSIYNVRTHILIEGCAYDIARRVPLNPPIPEP